MWCCKSNVAIEQRRHRPKKLASNQEDANSTAATNNSEDGSDTMANFQDTTHANFILQQMSNDMTVSCSTNSRSRNDNGETPSRDEVIQKHVQGVMHRESTAIVVSYEDDDDDNITTVYSEDTPLPNSMFNRHVSSPILVGNNHTSLGNNHANHMLNYRDKRNVKLPSNMHVLLPDVPQRGYEAIGLVRYPERGQWIRTKPYEIGTLVWYRYVSSSIKFKWYIPGQITNYVLTGDRVAGYEITVDCKDHILERHELGITSILKNAPPENTMLRWDEKIPPSPVEGIDIDGMPQRKFSAEKSLELASKKYGHDLGFEGAKQNGLGPEMWGITLEQIKEICKHPKYDETMSMYDVVNNIVKPMTAGTGMSYALHCNKESPKCARIMVSHGKNLNDRPYLLLQLPAGIRCSVSFSD